MRASTRMPSKTLAPHDAAWRSRTSSNSERIWEDMIGTHSAVDDTSITTFHDQLSGFGLQKSVSVQHVRSGKRTETCIRTALSFILVQLHGSATLMNAIGSVPLNYCRWPRTLTANPRSATLSSASMNRKNDLSEGSMLSPM